MKLHNGAHSTLDHALPIHDLSLADVSETLDNSRRGVFGEGALTPEHGLLNSGLPVDALKNMRLKEKGGSKYKRKNGQQAKGLISIED